MCLCGYLLSASVCVCVCVAISFWCIGAAGKEMGIDDGSLGLFVPTKPPINLHTLPINRKE